MAGETVPYGDPGGHDPMRLRVGDAERHRVAEVLREAAGEGRLELDELEARLDATWSARTYGDLVPLTADLPAHPQRIPLAPPVPHVPHGPPLPAVPQRTSHVAILGGFDRKGVWLVPPQMSIFCFWGGAELDLRQARFAAREVTITVNAVMGGCSIIVGPTTHVVVEGTGIMGGYSGPSGLVEARLEESSPTVRVRGVAFWGGVSVERKH